jgi:hypothetical protein
MEDPEMKRVTVNDKWDIKKLLYSDCVLGVRDDSCQSFGGFELWWYDKQHDTCHFCHARWSDLRRKIDRCSLDRAARRLWRKRNALFLRGKQHRQDPKIQTLTLLCN